MVVRVLPDWFSDVDIKITSLIEEIARDYDIPLDFVMDSKAIHEAKETILNTLVKIDDDCRVEERNRLKEFSDSIRKAFIKEKKL